MEDLCKHIAKSYKAVLRPTSKPCLHGLIFLDPLNLPKHFHNVNALLAIALSSDTLHVVHSDLDMRRFFQCLLFLFCGVAAGTVLTNITETG